MAFRDFRTLSIIISLTKVDAFKDNLVEKKETSIIIHIEFAWHDLASWQEEKVENPDGTVQRWWELTERNQFSFCEKNALKHLWDQMMIHILHQEISFFVVKINSNRKLVETTWHVNQKCRLFPQQNTTNPHNLVCHLLFWQPFCQKIFTRQANFYSTP